MIRAMTLNRLLTLIETRPVCSCNSFSLIKQKDKIESTLHTIDQQWSCSESTGLDGEKLIGDWHSRVIGILLPTNLFHFDLK